MNRLTEYLIRHGVLLIFVNVFAEQLGAPIPALPTLVVAGALARDGRLSLAAISAAALIASLIADSIWFFMGRRHGQRIVQIICKVSISPSACVQETESFFERWGLRSLIVAKFIPGFSTVAPPMAGSVGAPYLSFLFFDTLGVILWAGSGIAGGLIFYKAIDRVGEFLETFGYGALAIVGVVLAVMIIAKWRKRRSFYEQLRLARISPEELMQVASDEPNTLVLDVRTISARNAQPTKIPGAVVMDVGASEDVMLDEYVNREIILYCT